MLAVIDVVLREKREKEEIQNNLIWYDHVDKDMREFKTGQVSHEYVEFSFGGENLEVLFPEFGWLSGKMVVKPEKLYRQSSKLHNNAEDIMKWIRENEEEYGLELVAKDSREITVSFADGKETEVEESLYRDRFRYEILDA